MNLNRSFFFHDTNLIRSIAALFTAGIFLHIFPFFEFITTRITDGFLLLVNSLVLVKLLALEKRRIFLVFLGLSVLITYSAELAGILTGSIFGSYRYGTTLWVQILSVPIVIPYNWVMLVLGFTSMTAASGIPKTIVPFASALLLVLFDFIMEPVAMYLDFWKWSGDFVPFQNYLAWFLIAFILSSVTIWLRFNLESRLLRAYALIQLIFFGVLNLLYRNL